MIIRELNLKNFGKFSNQKFSFGDGLNVIYGENEAGKTTLYTAIGALLFGLEKQRGRASRTDVYTTCQPWEHRTWYEGSMRFEIGGKSFFLERNFYYPERSARLICETDGEELSVEQGDLKVLLSDTDADLFFNTVSAGQLKMKPGNSVSAELKNYIAGQQEEGSRSVDVVKALEILEKRKKALEQKKKKQEQDVRKSIEIADAKLEMTEKEISDYQRQLQIIKEEKLPDEEIETKRETGFFRWLLLWIKRLLFRKRFLEEESKRRERALKLEQKQQFLQELLGEKESIREELFLWREQLYEKLQQPSGEEELKALELAMERIRSLASQCQQEILSNLAKKASEALAKMTGGKYEKLFFDENGETVLWDGNRKLLLFQVSAGCKDQVYLSLRIGLQDLLLEDELPLIFDDAFVYFDEKRLEELLRYLSGMKRQVLIFTCHQRELRILEKTGCSYEKILL